MQAHLPFRYLRLASREAVLALDQGSLPCGELAGNLFLPRSTRCCSASVSSRSASACATCGGPTPSVGLSECCRLRPAEPLRNSS